MCRLGLDGAIRWLGHRADVADLLVACDVMVFPSRWEGLGSAVVEAMMLQTPVICADLDVLREVVGAANAHSLVNFVDVGRPTALAAALVEALGAKRPRAVDDRDLRPFLFDRVAAGYCRLAYDCLHGEGPEETKTSCLGVE